MTGPARLLGMPLLAMLLAIGWVIAAAEPSAPAGVGTDNAEDYVPNLNSLAQYAGQTDLPGDSNTHDDPLHWMAKVAGEVAKAGNSVRMGPQSRANYETVKAATDQETMDDYAYELASQYVDDLIDGHPLAGFPDGDDNTSEEECAFATTAYGPIWACSYR